jgi:hypothetical protein
MRLLRTTCSTLVVFLIAAGLVAAEPTLPALARFLGSDFSGGAKDTYGASYEGERVNCVYAQPTGPHARMQAAFTIDRLPEEPAFLHIRARDDECSKQHCDVEISLNGKSVAQGAGVFVGKGWQTRRIAIPAGVLKVGANELVITNREKAGALGMPPWFMVGWCAVAGERYGDSSDVTTEFFVDLPKEVRPFPEPLRPGQEPGFKIRGIKTWDWTPEMFLAEIPILAKYKMNFAMNCYSRMCDIENVPWGDARCNRWWEPLPDSKVQAYERIVRACQKAGIQFCFSLNPNISTSRIVRYDSTEDADLLWKRFSWMQGLGVKWFNLSLDDITEGINPSGQARMCNEIFRRLRDKDPQAQMIFCPTYYCGDGNGKEQRPYLETLARDLQKDTYVFWTGGSVCSARITRREAEIFKGIVKRRIIIWDNYPVNNFSPTLQLGPFVARDKDLCEVADGIMSNPHHLTNEINRIPTLTLADYAYNPEAYDPRRSIGQAIIHLAETDKQRAVLKDLVEASPGMLIHQQCNCDFNSIRERFNQLASTPHSRFIVEMYVRHIESLLERLGRVFPGQYEPEKKILKENIDWMRRALAAKYKP